MLPRCIEDIIQMKKGRCSSYVAFFRSNLDEDSCFCLISEAKLSPVSDNLPLRVVSINSRAIRVKRHLNCERTAAKKKQESIKDIGNI
jgi:hypothetical protein